MNYVVSILLIGSIRAHRLLQVFDCTVVDCTPTAQVCVNTYNAPLCCAETTDCTASDLMVNDGVDSFVLCGGNTYPNECAAACDSCTDSIPFCSTRRCPAGYSCCDDGKGNPDCCQDGCSYTEEYNPYCCGGKEFVNPGQASCAGVDVTDKSNICAPGTCCGGIQGIGCEDGFTCNAIPGDDCSTDCFGSCQKETNLCVTTKEYNPYCCGSTTYGNPSEAACDDIDVEEDGSCQQGSCCRGMQGIECSDGLKCVDIPNDDCDPDEGGADCMGSCQIVVTDERVSCRNNGQRSKCEVGYVCMKDPECVLNGEQPCDKVCADVDASSICKSNDDCGENFECVGEDYDARIEGKCATYQKP